ncbi:hypothetical protein HDV00_003141 [Rhizophlyctis rosea]|nr:hypothetical protein HDV00_003141 [Rhizophlyctis rosea]
MLVQRQALELEAYRVRSQALAASLAGRITAADFARIAALASSTIASTKMPVQAYPSPDLTSLSAAYPGTPPILPTCSETTPTTQSPIAAELPIVKYQQTNRSPPPPVPVPGLRRKSMSSVMELLHSNKRAARSTSPEDHDISSPTTGLPVPLQKEIHVPIDEILNEERRLCGQSSRPPPPSVRWTTDATGKKKKARHLTTPFQTRVLRRVLAYTAFPSTEQRAYLALEMGMTPRGVQIWFQNQRQKAKARQVAHQMTQVQRAMHRPLRAVSVGAYTGSNDAIALNSIPEWQQQEFMPPRDAVQPIAPKTPDLMALAHPSDPKSEIDDEDDMDAPPLHHAPDGVYEVSPASAASVPEEDKMLSHVPHAVSPSSSAQQQQQQSQQQHRQPQQQQQQQVPTEVAYRPRSNVPNHQYTYTIQQNHKEVKVSPCQHLHQHHPVAARMMTGAGDVGELGMMDAMGADQVPSSAGTSPQQRQQHEDIGSEKSDENHVALGSAEWQQWP